MIVVQVTEASLRKAVSRAAHAEEDVVADARLALDALEWGFPRLLVKSEDVRLPLPPRDVPVLDLDEMTLRRWEVQRRSSELPLSRIEYCAGRLAVLIEQAAKERTWVDGVLADLTRAAGAQLPRPLRTFARRILEFPVHYTTLHQLADVCQLSRGALKAKFRRRGLASPYTYLRWLRLMAVADLLSERSVTVAQAGRRIGFTSAGNLCRMMGDVCGMTPTEVRSVRGRNRLLLSFAWKHLTPEALEAWADLGELFRRRVA